MWSHDMQTNVIKMNNQCDRALYLCRPLYSDMVAVTAVNVLISMVYLVHMYNIPVYMYQSYSSCSPSSSHEVGKLSSWLPVLVGFTV